MTREKVLGSFVFPTRKAAEEHIRAVLHGNPLRRPLVGHDRELITALVGCHPEADAKIGCGIASIDVRTIEHGSRGFWITRTDGSSTDFSYRKALDGAKSHKATVLEALRRQVKPQVDAFRADYFASTADPRCVLTDQPLYMGPDAHVDHVDPTFAELAERFVSALGGWDVVAVGASPKGIGSCLSDQSQALIWAVFHEQHARLRVIHRSANLARYRRAAA